MSFTFDWNDWFFIISSLIFMSIFFLLPKRFNSTVTLMYWIFIVVFIETIDYFLGVKPYDFYDFLDGPSYEPTVALAHLTIYPSTAYIFIYYYDKWNLSGLKLYSYIAAWTIFSVAYEWLCIQNDVLTYKIWNLLLSVPTYPISCYIVIKVFQFIKRNFKTITFPY